MTRLYYSLNSNYGNFYPISLNVVSNSWQDNVLSEGFHLFHIFYFNFAVKKGQTWKNKKKIIFSKFTPSNFIIYKFEQNVYVHRFEGSSFPFSKKFEFIK